MNSKSVLLCLSTMAVATALSARDLRPDLKLPLTFIENRGQKDNRIRYYAQGDGYSVFLTHDGVVLSFGQGSTTLRFIGTNPRARIEGSEPAAGVIHYLHGNDPAQWRTGLPHYSQVIYRDLWPGTDL